MEFDSAEGYDCAEAWESGHPFIHLKSELYRYSFVTGSFDIKYPNEEIFNGIATKTLVADAMRNGKKISVHYNWEPFDDNIIVYSASGMVLFVDISVNDEEVGFMLDSPESESLMVFPYNKIFWLEEAEGILP
jgi:hypothetical protein